MNSEYKMPGIRANVARYATYTPESRKACRRSYEHITPGRGNAAARRIAPLCYKTEPGKFTFAWLQQQATPQQRRSTQHLIPSIRAYFTNKHHAHPALNTDR